jgi:GDPmannose 4,6-dehydratase
LFNHESPRRGTNFVTRKVTEGVAEIKKGLRDVILLGNLDARRDWGYAPEYMEAAWRMLQQNNPDDYVVATGETHSIRELAEEAFRAIEKELGWSGNGLNEVGFDKKTGKVLVKIDEEYFRPNEVSYLRGDYKKAREILGWSPKVIFEELIKMMVEEDIKKIEDIKL